MGNFDIKVRADNSEFSVGSRILGITGFGINLEKAKKDFRKKVIKEINKRLNEVGEHLKNKKIK